MKATGIVRKIDDLGRLVLPKELRRTMKINPKDPMEIYVEDDGSIILRKYEPACVFCGNADDVFEYRDRVICKECLEEMENASA